MEVNPIAVILVYMDSKGDRLLYRFPYQQQQQTYAANLETSNSGVQSGSTASSTVTLASTTAITLPSHSHSGFDLTQTNSVPPSTSNLNVNYDAIKKRSPYAIINTDDLLQTAVQATNKICINKGQLQGLADRMLSTLLAVKLQLCHQKFELKINDVRFVSHPTLIPRKERVVASTTTNISGGDNLDMPLLDGLNHINNAEQDSNKTAETLEHPVNSMNINDTELNYIIPNSSNVPKTQPQQMLINVVFALHAQANYSIVKCYHELSKKLGLVLRVEEQRIGYVTDETLIMMRTHDEVTTLQQPLERVFDLISERSTLAQAIKSIYHDLCTTGLIGLTLNQTKTLAFCMPQKAHQLHKKGSIVDPDAIHNCLGLLKPYHGILLLVDFAELLDCVPPPAVRMLLQLIEVYTPLLSLQNMASDADISIENVYKIVSHLVYWAKATIIYPLCETNVYVIAPDAPLHTKSHLVEKFAQRFASISLFEAIADFSLPTSIGHLTTPLQQPARQGILVQMVLWMLQHHLLIQLHTYVQFMTCASDKGGDARETQHLIDSFHIEHSLTQSMAATRTNVASSETNHLLHSLSLLHLNDADLNTDLNVNNSLLSMSSQPLPVPSHSIRHGNSETEGGYSAAGSTLSDNIAVVPSSSHKSNYSMTASVSTDNCESIDSIEDEEKIKELLQIFNDADCIAIRRIPASNNLEDLALLVKLYQAGYFKSEHHLEEIMYFENLRRSQLLQLLDKFRDVLIIYETEDPAIALMYHNK